MTLFELKLPQLGIRQLKSRLLGFPFLCCPPVEGRLIGCYLADRGPFRRLLQLLARQVK